MLFYSHTVGFKCSLTSVWDIRLAFKQKLQPHFLHKGDREKDNAKFKTQNLKN